MLRTDFYLIDSKSITLIFIGFFFIALSFYVSRLDINTDSDEFVDVTSELDSMAREAPKKDKLDQKKIPPSLMDTDEYVIHGGDTLTALRKNFSLSDKLFYALLDADGETLALDNIKPGQKIIVSRKEGEIKTITLQYNPAKKILYNKTQINTFTVKWVDTPGIWHNELIEGEVKGTFSGSAVKYGLTISETVFINHLLKHRVNFHRDFRKGNAFKVLLSRQYVNGQLTGQSKVLAIQLGVNKKTIETFLYNGQYYDEKGQNIEQSFDPYPFKGKFSVTSRYSLKRKHPITGLYKPHYGVDYAMPVGTLVNATGDGIVSRVVRNQFAGLYIEIDHGSHYQTRYLHLNKALVKKGQKITRGMVIAKSGVSGRVTGPHLHYEFHVNGRPINPVKASASRSLSLDKKDKPLFTKKVQNFKYLLTGQKAGISKV